MARVSQSAVFDKIGYQPHDGQKTFHKQANSARFRILDAGRRTGKSTAGGHELVQWAYLAYLKRGELDPLENRMEYWIVGPEYSDSEKEFRVLYNDLKKRGFEFDHPGTYYNPLAGDMHISLFDGRFQVHAKSAKYPQNLVGEKLRGVILAEAAKLKPAIWTKYLRPMLADYRGFAIMSSTPEGKNWFYEEYMKGISNDPKYHEYAGLKMPSWTNNIVFPGGRADPEILSMEAGMSSEKFKQEVGAEFTDFVGRVFKDFDEETHTRHLEYDPTLQTYACVDYGWTNPFVWLLIQVDHWQNVYVIGEFYQSHVRIDEVPEILKARGLVPPTLRTFYPDPASPGDTRVLEDSLKIKAVGGGKTGGSLNERLDLIRKWLKVPKHLRHLDPEHHDRVPKLLVDPEKCPNFVREFNDYRYPENKNEETTNESELPLKKDDHTPEALGRGLKGLFGAQERARTGAVTSGSNMG